MDVAEVFPLHLELELSESFNERHALDVPHCASQLLTQNNCLDSKCTCMNIKVSDSLCPTLSDSLRQNIGLSGAFGP